MKIVRAVAFIALLIYASETGRALCDLCPAPLVDGTLTIPGITTLQLKASTHGDAVLTGPLGAISGQASITCQSGEFNAALYGMSDGSLYRCRATIDGQRFTGHCLKGNVTGEISGRFLVQPWAPCIWSERCIVISDRENHELIGYGMATGSWKALMIPHTVRAALTTPVSANSDPAQLDGALAANQLAPPSPACVDYCTRY
jgi:hypothetical protein